jgi:uncharacterized protein YkwD
VLFRVSLCLASLLATLSIVSPPAVVARAARLEPVAGGRVTAPSQGRTTVHDRRAAVAGAVTTTRMPTEDERRLLELTNADRARHGLALLELDVELLDLARARAAAQVSGASLSHRDAAGEVALGKLLDEAGVPYALAAENLARVEATPLASQAAQQALMRSREHRENILEPAFNRLAVGSALEGAGRITFAEIFRAAP